MQNKLNEGRTLKYTTAVDESVIGGQAVKVGDVLGVAAADIMPSATGILEVEGVFGLPKDSIAIPAGTTVAFVAGKITISGTEKGIGKAWNAAKAADPTVYVKINV